MKIYPKATFNMYGTLTDVYECEVCGTRSTFKKFMIKHEEEHKVKEDKFRKVKA